MYLYCAGIATWSFIMSLVSDEKQSSSDPNGETLWAGEP